MDVERLMRDLKVDQLQEIQRNLQTEVEGKKEELREMVGRRYRDVLEASSEVRHVRKLADDLAEAVACARTTQCATEPRPLSREQQASIQRFIALHRLLAVIGGPDGDALSDAFAFTLAELLHKQLTTEPLPPSIHSVVSGLTGRVIRTRRKLLEDLEEEIGQLSEPNWVANQLTALALLQGADYEKLLDTYLKSREKYIVNLTNESSSLLNVVTELKMTLAIVEQLFAQGELVRIIHAAANSTYRPELIDLLIADEPFTFGRVLINEAEKVTRQLRESKASPLLLQKINSKCMDWTNRSKLRVCDVVRELMVSICEFYTKASDMIEFINALSEVLSKDCPRISCFSTVYKNLYGDVLFKKFMSIISSDLRELENRLTSQLKSVNTAPPPLFEKSSNKFHPLTGSGISSALEEYVSYFITSLNSVMQKECQQNRSLSGTVNARECCARYEQVEMDLQPGRVKESFAAELFEVIERLSNLRLSDEDGKSGSELSRARLCLALLQCNSISFCQAMNKDGKRIASASRLLNAAAEESLTCVLIYFLDLGRQRNDHNSTESQCEPAREVTTKICKSAKARGKTGNINV
ncbi:hypothetical protein KIN20_001068 [Parelaphostrongylus tenuis]|uniref:Conserved oligomeric Golgi complex subunit 1 n=1 Tax=Parelaphostrongylus tenuis TaxID=148309 RepID=A0AAD5LVM2_PARTN|nr:hypothetical protein KIN20_001068 [Parelaphostrongylus tenuis]